MVEAVLVAVRGVHREEPIEAPKVLPELHTDKIRRSFSSTPWQHRTLGRWNMFVGSEGVIPWGRRPRYNVCSGPTFCVDPVQNRSELFYPFSRILSHRPATLNIAPSGSRTDRGIHNIQGYFPGLT